MPRAVRDGQCPVSAARPGSSAKATSWRSGRGSDSAMKPVSADTSDPQAPAPPAPRAAPARDAWRHDTNVRTALASFAFFLLCVAGAFLFRDTSDPLGANRTGRGDQHSVGTIKFAPEGDLCRQITIDTRTGQVLAKGRLPCDKPLAGASEADAAALKERAAGNRIDVVRDSFRSR